MTKKRGAKWVAAFEQYWGTRLPSVWHYVYFSSRPTLEEVVPHFVEAGLMNETAAENEYYCSQVISINPLWVVIQNHKE